VILFFISFIAGVLTAIAPCVLPLLPVIVGGSMATGGEGQHRLRSALIIASSLGISVILFTLLLKASTIFIDIPQLFWQLFSGVILIVFGFVLFFPQLWDNLGFVNLLNRSSNQLLASGYQRHSFVGDIIMGAALGPVFSSCSPTYFVVLATVLPASFGMGLLDLFAYALGLSGFLLLIAIAGQKLVDKLGVAIEPGGWFRRTIGVLFLIVGLAVATGAEASTEAWLLSHGFDLTFIEQRLLGGNNQTARAPSPSLPEGKLGLGASSTPSFLTMAEKALRYQKAPELTSVDGYINTNGKPITISQFKGNKVVLIDFWTYSCINCQRTLPYLKAWYDKYHDQGLEIIGVHTPEFAFERLLGNVQTAVQGFGIKYPVVLDNEYGTWNAFGNEYWPNKYLIDIDGYIVYNHSGEGNYDETEKAIQKALAERAQRLGTAMPSATSTTVNAINVNGSQLGSPETYFGSNRNEFLGNGVQGQSGIQTLTLPAISDLRANTLYLGGAWNFTPEYASNKDAGAKIEFVYKAKHVYFVAAGTNGPVKIKVTRDEGEALGAAAGKDVDGNGEATISGDRLYELVSDSEYGAHLLEIKVEAPGIQAYTFTFG